MKRLLLVFFMCGSCMGPALADTLYPGTVLHATFTVPASPNCTGGACDVLLFSPPISGTTGSITTTVKLYNGSTLLGTFSTGGASSGIFESSTSLFQAGGALVDFTSIQDGTIDGIFDYSITGGTQTLNPGLTGSQIILTHGVGPNTGNGGYFLMPNSVSITAEPSSFVLMLTGAWGLVCARRIPRPQPTAGRKRFSCHSNEVSG